MSGAPASSGTPRVLDLTDQIAAQAGRLLVALGADVIRVEPETQPAAALTRAAQLHWHAGKRVIQTDDPAVLGELARDADVVIESGPRRALRGLAPHDPDSEQPPLSRWPHLIHVVVTPFGLTGPKRDWLADDLVLTAAGGMAWLGGHPDRQPKPPPREQAGQLAGAHAATAALLGLLAADRLGTGQLIDISAQEAVAATLETAVISWLAASTFPRRNGGVYQHVAHRIFRSRDGYVAGGYSGSERMWTDLRAWMAETSSAADLTDQVWDDADFRWRNRAYVDEIVARFAARFSSAELSEQARNRALPWADVAPVARLLDNPQLQARNYFLRIDGDGPALWDVGYPFESPARPRPVTISAPQPVTTGAAWPTGRRPRRPATPAGARAGDGALSGLRVLDLTWVLAGPYATKQLAEHGADVIKIESRHRHDPTRFSPGMRLRPGATADDGAYFMNFNRNKRSVAVNMRTRPGVEIVRRLARRSDVLIENYSPGLLARWGLDYDSLRADHPGITVVSMSGVGMHGPWRNAVTFADTLAAMSGLSDETRDPGEPPEGLTFGLGDMIAGNAAVLAVLDRLRLGTGGAVDLSQLEAMAAFMGTAVLDQQLPAGPAASTSRAHPNRHPRLIPHGIYPASGDDRWIAISVGSDDAWRRLAGLVPSLAHLVRADATARRAREDEIDDRLAGWTAGQQGEQLAELLQRHDVAASAVATGQDLVDGDGHLAARGFYPQLTHPTAGDVRHEGIVIRAALTPGSLRTASPLLGEHTDTVLSELLAMRPDEIAELRAGGVLE